MFIRDYLKNPMGKGIAVYPTRQMFNEYKDRYEKIANDIKYRLYLIKDNYYFHFRVPSNVEGIFYDVVIEFKNNGNSTNNTILDWDFRVFSNCPSFVYTYAYAYNKKGLLLKELDKNFANAAHKMPSEVRNPYKFTGYEFSTFMALYSIMQRRVYLLSYLSQVAIPSKTMGIITNDIQDMDSILKRRKAQQSKLREEERQERMFRDKEKKLLNNIEIENDKGENMDIKTNKINSTARRSNTSKRITVAKKTKRL